MKPNYLLTFVKYLKGLKSTSAYSTIKTLVFKPNKSMLQLTLNEAQNQLPELLRAVSEGPQVIIQNNEGQDFQIISLSSPVKRPQYGSAKGIVKPLTTLMLPSKTLRTICHDYFNG
ncbi:type II toxin-antitoxin system Phd/YefM family antitoxin [Microcystis aeruginosa]|jgi:prevent-host-death family protein|uniref:type II toxin-antitoxin system Phd/YefM family antitoxin n=1 Tax=Microcystis aeruginosa TaxID=1126 RepID=UPI001E298DCC|nr:type II toxin-antitoxin system prevent-host-death family antitoxin [Microcystis aeruginosa]